MLRYHADAALPYGDVRHVAAIEAYGSGTRGIEPGDKPEQRRFTTTGGAEQGNQFTGSDVQINVIQRRETAETLADGFQSESAHDAVPTTAQGQF
ncbi:MAG: hypothetical protein MnENMB40S_33460 [Rhizobiaceae bacterium MnEN-MB40S]|nr:MAG: hypothetical protein MnENMB40S_33460 [Rhizobiaceae bacterium MnEN-MB40S]